MLWNNPDHLATTSGGVLSQNDTMTPCSTGKAEQKINGKNRLIIVTETTVVVMIIFVTAPRSSCGNSWTLLNPWITRDSSQTSDDPTARWSRCSGKLTMPAVNPPDLYKITPSQLRSCPSASMSQHQIRSCKVGEWCGFIVKLDSAFIHCGLGRGDIWPRSGLS